MSLERRHPLTRIMVKTPSVVTTAFSALNVKWDKNGRCPERRNLLDDCVWGTISSKQLVCCGTGFCYGFKSTVGSATTGNQEARRTWTSRAYSS